jgi:plasmid maintenance system antidote protein VapI
VTTRLRWFAAMYSMTITVAGVARRFWPGRHDVGLAEALEVPVPTARSWISGSRRMSARRMQQLHEFLTRQAALALSLQSDLEFQIALEAQRFKPRRGFFVVKYWDGTGVRTNQQ